MYVSNGILMSTVLACAMLYASVSDYRSHRVPNWLNASLALGGILYSTLFGGGLAMSLMGLATGFALLFGLWLLRMMGAGDVKYMAALGAWLGPQLTLYSFCIGGLLGGLWAIAKIVRSRSDWQMGVIGLMNSLSPMTTALAPGGCCVTSGKAGVLPYAVPLSIGTMSVLVLEQIGWWVP